MAKFGLVLFYSDSKVVVVKKSICVLRKQFESGNDVEVKSGKEIFLARILRTNTCEQPLSELCAKSCRLIDEAGEKRAEQLIEILDKSLDRDQSSTPESMAKSKHGRARKKIDYNQLLDISEEPNEQGKENENAKKHADAKKEKKKNKKTCDEVNKNTEDVVDVDSQAEHLEDIDDIGVETEQSSKRKIKASKSKPEDISEEQKVEKENIQKHAAKSSVKKDKKKKDKKTCGDAPKNKSEEVEEIFDLSVEPGKSLRADVWKNQTKSKILGNG